MDAITTVGVYLGYRAIDAAADSTYTKLCDITDFPDLAGEMERAETTTLSEKVARTYKKTIRNSNDLTFTANYNREEYKTIQEMEYPTDEDAETEYAFCLMFEQDGSVIEWTGEISVGITGGGIGEAVHMNVTIVTTTPPKLNTKKTATLDGDTITLA